MGSLPPNEPRLNALRGVGTLRDPATLTAVNPDIDADIVTVVVALVDAGEDGGVCPSSLFFREFELKSVVERVANNFPKNAFNLFSSFELFISSCVLDLVPFLFLISFSLISFFVSLKLFRFSRLRVP